MLVIENCKLKYLFSPSSARGLVNLEQLIVKQCEIMEAIVGFEGQKEENEIIFSKLKELHLEGLPNLKCFYAENEKTRTSIGSSFARVQTLFNEKVILPVLERLEVTALDSIEEIWDKQSPSVYQETESFGQLRDITVEGCKKLMNLVPSNILPRLRNLQFLVVNDCPNVEFVVFKNEKGEEEVADDSTLIIPQLSYLRIWNMERLKRFCSSSTTSNAQSLFNHQVAFPALEDISISEVPMIRGIWVQQPENGVESFCKLKSITVRNCDQLEYVLPSYMLPQLHNLLELDIGGCKALEVIVSNKLKEKEATNNDILVFPQLKTLKLWELDNLKFLFYHKVAFPVLEDIDIWKVPMITGIWVQQPLSKPEKDVESFCKLKSIQVQNCDQLEYVLPSYMLPHLHNLLKLDIRECKELEVIVSNKLKEKEATNNDILVFPQLKTLALRELNNLKCFCTGTDQLLFSHKVAFPALEHLTITKVPKIKEIWDKQPLSEAEKEAISFCNLRRIDVQHCDQLVYVFSNKVILPVLEELKVEALNSIEDIWDKQSPSVNQETESFGQLRNIEVKGCKKLMNLVPSNILPRLRNLQFLKVEDCPNIEFIVFKNSKGEEEAADDSTLIIPQLRHLMIIKMEKLESFYSSSTTSNAQSLFNHQVIFPVLECLDIWGVDNIIEIWDKQSIALFDAQGSFCQLMNLQVWDCNKLMHLFPSKMHLLLKNLKTLDVMTCETMEGVIGFEEELDEDGLRNEQVCFNKLTSLSLTELPKLVSFCTKMGEVGTTEGNPIIHAEPFFNGKVAFPALEDLQISSLSNITEIWEKKPLPEPEQEIESFSKLATIRISGCDQLVYVLPSYMLPRLQNLRRLDIYNCKEVEVIVSKELMKEKEAIDNYPIVFSQLNDVDFDDLPKLKGFYTGTQLFFSDKDAFPKLEEIELDDDLEFLQNGTSTKEECGTSGKENDHNVEED